MQIFVFSDVSRRLLWKGHLTPKRVVTFRLRTTSIQSFLGISHTCLLRSLRLEINSLVTFLQSMVIDALFYLCGQAVS